MELSFLIKKQNETAGKCNFMHCWCTFFSDVECQNGKFKQCPHSGVLQYLLSKWIKTNALANSKPSLFQKFPIANKISLRLSSNMLLFYL